MSKRSYKVMQDIDLSQNDLNKVSRIASPRHAPSCGSVPEPISSIRIKERHVACSKI